MELSECKEEVKERLGSERRTMDLGWWLYSLHITGTELKGVQV